MPRSLLATVVAFVVLLAAGPAAADDESPASRSLRAQEDGSPDEDRWQRALRPLVVQRYDRVFHASTPLAAVAFGTPLFVTTLRDPYDLPMTYVMMPGTLILDALCTIGFGALHGGVGFAIRPRVLRDLDEAVSPDTLAAAWQSRSRGFALAGLLGLAACSTLLLAPLGPDDSGPGWHAFLLFGAAASVPFALIAEGIAHAQLARLVRAGEGTGDDTAWRGPRITAIGPSGIAGVW